MSSVVEREISPHKLNDLDYNPEFNLVKDTVFLKAIFLGSKYLYEYSDGLNNPQFYIHHNGEYKLLKHKRYLKMVDKSETLGLSSNRVLKHNNQYIGLLGEYFNKNTNRNIKLSEVQYNRESLISVFQEFYGGSGVSYVYIPGNPAFRGPANNFSIFISGGNNKVTAQTDESNVVATTPNSYPNPTLAIRYHHSLKNSLYRKSLIFELNANIVAYSNTYKEIEDEVSYSVFSNSFSYWFLNLAAMYNYKIPLNNSAFYFIGGPFAGVMIQDQSYAEELRYVGIVSKRFYYEYEKIVTQGGLVAGAGFEINRFLIDIRSILNAGFNKSFGITTVSGGLNVGLGISF